MCRLAAEVFLVPIDALALLAKLERGGEDGQYGGGAKEEKRSSDGEVHCRCGRSVDGKWHWSRNAAF